MTEGEEKGLLMSVGSWVWGTVKGGFNEQQSISQIIVDAVIGMIPLVGDVTAVRDLIAVVLRLVQQPEKRKEKMEWVLLVILLFALIPVVGGAIKGVGRLLVKAGQELAQMSTHIAQFIKVLSRVGDGNAVKWFKSLDLEAFLPVVRAKWTELAGRLNTVIDRVLVKMRHLLPDSMLEHLAQLKTKLGEVMQLAESKIPEALKDLNARLKQVQRQLYEGAWEDIPASFRSITREAEARLVVTAKGEVEWAVSHAHFPQNGLSDYHHVPGLPDLRELRDKQLRLYAIEGFSGEIKAVRIPGGTKLYRIIDYRRPWGAAGNWWAYELPAGGRQWREGYAVLDDFSHNRVYVEITVPPEGLLVWEGKAASQIDRGVASQTSKQYLPGGATQLFVDFEVTNAHAAHLAKDAPQLPTNWTDVMGVNVPDRVVVAEELAQHEIASKRAVSKRRATVAAGGVRAAEGDRSSGGSAP
jgi:hypothetical protein